MMTPVKKTSAIRPAEFYGNGLPRPRFFDNPKFNSHRVDPLLSWAREAHWSMGGLNFTRLRLQGRIEGNVDKLRAQLDNSSPLKKRSRFDSSPAAPVAVKRRRYIDLNDEDDEEEEICLASIRRKLSDDFDRVAGEEINTKPTKKPIVEEKTKETQKVEETSSTRSSPRLAKRRST